MRVTLKLATSLDGKIATASGESRWITGPEAREAVHRLRLTHMAVMVGVETAIADDPELTVRLQREPTPSQPTRIVLDSRQRLPLTSLLVQGARRIPTIVLTTQPSNKLLTDAGVRVIEVAARDGRVDPGAALQALEQLNLPALMIEGGGQVAASFLGEGLVDAVEWFRAPIMIGAEGRPAVAALGLNGLESAPRFRRTSAQAVGEDLWERYERV
jgi:diaminohydroxyphosphoribosylaminopyrimidine deaminase / 5-amino-6-(5-phosphoribosylamino)uracil reductase